MKGQPLNGDSLHAAGSAPCRNSEYALKIVEERRLAGGGHELHEASYAALATAPEEMHAIVNYFRGGADTPREEDVTTTLRAFVARRRLGEAVTFRQVRSQREAQNDELCGGGPEGGSDAR